jgi:hypothetical protein
MHFEKKHEICFKYQREQYNAIVEEVRFAGDRAIYRINITKKRYWLLYDNGIWRFISDVTPGRPLERLLTQKISSKAFINETA